MINNVIFKAYDIRGIYPNEINKESIEEISKVLAHVFNDGVIVIGRDGRISSKELYDTAIHTFFDEGKKINKNFVLKTIDLCTTPMLYFLVNDFSASGGIMITASHNPKEYNGIKAVKEKAIPISGLEILSEMKKYNIQNGLR